ncbi:GH92 family glycosyl hydrolase [Actinophytocola oryzae]|uniref:Putative alpha-1,2-mannosidase n=1 Tax=Actinophytocola oryzae TaxID=502181 RepID=A0A4R7W282_9PSEU|nr:GH92 family glycosyl hydrolase [Actinophytocola oryzae]TDV56118.1 putative alpha-1,2-mannosidase [Actinophytocola oryzae]
MMFSRWRRRLVAALCLGVALTFMPATPVGAQEQAGTPRAEDLARLVNPYIGTKKGCCTGLTYPGAVAPFGMVQWSPDTVLSQVGGYNYNDNRIKGFSLTHLSGAGCTIYQDVPFIPFAGDVTTSPGTDSGRYVSTFNRANESASPGNYAVGFDSGLSVKLTATQRTGAAELSFPAGATASLLVNSSGSVNGVTDASITIGADSISGYAASGNFCGFPHGYKVYFHAIFDKPFTSHGTWKDGTVSSGQSTATGGKSGGYVTFAAGQTVNVRVGVSYVSVDGARKNLAGESGTRTFADLSTAARAAWNERLNRIATKGGTDTERVTFYTALYHALLHPNVFSDVDGSYLGFDNKVHAAASGHVQYTNISGWDVYRSEIALLALLAPKETSDIIRSMVNFAKEAGFWDRWTIANGTTNVMVGDPYHAMVDSGFAFGAKDFDAGEALALMVRGATQPSQERPGLPEFQQYGYVSTGATGVWGAAATTLEYESADFAIADLAKRLGDTATYTTFSKRSQAWQNLYNPATGYLQMRNADGTFRQPFSPTSLEGFVEGNSTQYSWMVPHNQRGLIDAMGGNTATVARLDDFFQKLNAGADAPYAWMGNEPIMHVPWLYNYAGAPGKTQSTTRRIMNELFTSAPDGLAGNDDLGQMSSWYVWAALGMYPTVPGRAELAVNGSLFTEAVITRPTGARITIKASGAATNAPYIRSMKVNGVAQTRNWLPESFAEKGGTVEYTMSSSASSWGSGTADAPPSFRDGEATQRGFVQPDRSTIPANSGTSVFVGVDNLSGAAGSVAWKATPPAGITVEPSSGTINPATGSSGTQKVTVRVAAGTATGSYRVPVTYTTAGGATLPPNGIQVLVDTPGGLREAYSSVAQCPDDRQSVASYDPHWNYSANALAAVGVTPGATLTVDGISHRWPSVGVGEPDNVVAKGQTIVLPNTAGATRLSILGSATAGASNGTMTITYTDGTTQQADVGLSDWGLDGGLKFGNKVVASPAYRNSLYGVSAPLPSNILATAPITLASGKTVRSVTLPASVTGGVMHIFTITTA